MFRAFIELGIVDTEQYERSDSFQIEIDPPIWAKKMNGTVPDQGSYRTPPIPYPSPRKFRIPTCTRAHCLRIRCGRDSIVANRSSTLLR